MFKKLLKIYQLCFSPFFGKRCRFLPTCSEYAVLSVEKYGLVKGGFLAIKRILKCNRFFKPKIDLP